MSDDILKTISENTKTAIGTLETALKAEVKEGDLSVNKLMEFQLNINKWNIISQLGSVAVKAMGEAMRGILQRIN